MKKIRLINNKQDILGSDGILYLDGRWNMDSIFEFIRARNYRMKKNFPHKLAHKFYFVNDRIERISKNYNL